MYIKTWITLGVRNIEKRHWNGADVFIMLHRLVRDASSSILWDRILEYNNLHDNPATNRTRQRGPRAA